MTQNYLISPSVSLFVLMGIILVVAATIKAVLARDNYQKLILWGMFSDIGLIIVGLGIASSYAFIGIMLFALFQFFSRILAYYSLICLTHKDLKPTAHDLRGMGIVRNKYAGYLFALGLLASLGGSPFLVPEGRFYIIQALASANMYGNIVVPVLLAICSTVFIWLSLKAIINVCFNENTNLKSKKTALPAVALILGLIVALFGLLRTPITAFFTSLVDSELAIHGEPSHVSYYILYFGAFILCGLNYKMDKMRNLGSVLIFSLALLLIVFVNDMSPIAYVFAIMVGLIGLVVSIYSVDYIAHSSRVMSYQFFLLLTFASLIGIVTTQSLASFYGYWELMTFASFFLVIHERTQEAIKAGLKYYVMCAGGAFIMLPALAILSSGSDNIGLIASTVSQFDSNLLIVISIFLLLGFAVKAGLVPLHSWLPDAHPAAPSSVSGPLSGVITKMGIFGIVSIILGQAGGALLNIPGQLGLSYIGYCICLMGGLTLIYGEYMALFQKDIKRILAYSTLGQIGEITLVLGLGTWLATVGALSHVVNHAIIKDLLFLGAGAIIMRCGSRQLSDFAGIAKDMPWTVSCMAIGLISIMGLPPFTVFFSKYLMIQAAVDAGYMEFAVLILLGSLVGAIYYTRILKVLVFDKRPENAPKVEEVPWAMRGALVFLAALSIILGLVPQLVLGQLAEIANMYFIAQDSAKNIIDSVNVSWPVYVFVPIFGAIIPAFFRNDARKSGQLAVWLLLTTALLVVIFGQNLDTLSFSFALIVPLMGALNMYYASGYMEHSHTQWRFYCAFCCMCGGLIGVASSEYLFSFFLFWEIMSSWALYMALAHEGTRDSMREAFKYFMFNLAGAGFIFIGVTIIGASAPLSLGSALVFNLSPDMATAGIALLAIGFVMKAAQLPFRIDWQMHPALAPTPVSGFISSVLLKSAIFGLVKLFFILCSGLALSNLLNVEYEGLIRLTVMWVGGITIIMAAMQALMSDNLKLVFIYSTVSQIGYMVLAVGIGSALGYAGTLLHVANHILFKDLLFLVCGAIMFQTHKETLADLGGIGRKMPMTLCMFAIGGLSVVGIPPTNGFTSKWIIYQALMAEGQVFLAILSLVGSVITLAYIAKFLHAAFMGEPAREFEHVQEAPARLLVPMQILGAGCIITGVFPGILLYPINAILAEYGFKTLDIALSGITYGVGAWNATAVSFMAGIAFFISWKFIDYFVSTNSRIVDSHVCGLEPNGASTRMATSSIYASLVGLLRKNKNTKEG